MLFLYLLSTLPRLVISLLTVRAHATGISFIRWKHLCWWWSAMGKDLVSCYGSPWLMYVTLLVCSNTHSSSIPCMMHGLTWMALFIYSHKAGVNLEQGFFTHEVYSDELFFRLAEAAVDIIGKWSICKAKILQHGFRVCLTSWLYLCL